MLSKEERNKVVVSEFPKSIFHINLFVFQLQDSRVRPNAKYSSHLLTPGATKGFKRNRNSCYEIIRKIVSLKIQADPLINL